jgi:hypothetical protein
MDPIRAAARLRASVGTTLISLPDDDRVPCTRRCRSRVDYRTAGPLIVQPARRGQVLIQRDVGGDG